MATEIKMPSVGTTTDEVRIISWKVKEGQYVKKGDILCEVETDKAVVEIECYAEGTILKIFYNDDSLVNVGSILAIVGNLGEDINEYIKKISQSERFIKKANIVKENKPQNSNIKNTVSENGIKNFRNENKVNVNKFDKNVETNINRDIEKNEDYKNYKIENDYEKLLQMYKKMYEIRAFEEKVKFLFLEGKMPGTIHQYIGMEACATGVCMALEENDIIASTHRPVGHALARGLTANELMAELYGKVTGCCKGKGGAMHLGDLNKGMIPAIAVVGGNIPIITGVALSFKMRNENRVAVSFFGDGASNEGAFHEALNIAAVFNLPAVFVCENNGYSASTSIKKTLKIENIADRASSYGMQSFIADGMNVLDVYKKAKKAIDDARNKKSPTLLELKTFRFCGHSRRDPNTYMSEEEKIYWKSKDPIINFESYLINEAQINIDIINKIKEEIDIEIENSVKFAEKSPYPSPEEVFTDCYVNLVVPK